MPRGKCSTLSQEATARPVERAPLPTLRINDDPLLPGAACEQRCSPTEELHSQPFQVFGLFQSVSTDRSSRDTPGAAPAHRRLHAGPKSSS